METWHDMNASLPENNTGAHTVPAPPIPAGVFVFGSVPQTDASQDAGSRQPRMPHPYNGQAAISAQDSMVRGSHRSGSELRARRRGSSGGRAGSRSAAAAAAKFRARRVSTVTPSAALACAGMDGRVQSCAHGDMGDDRALASSAEEHRPVTESGRGDGAHVNQEREGGDGAGCGEAQKSGGRRPPWSKRDREAAIRQQQQRLLLLRHASRCQTNERGGVCQVSADCAKVKVLWRHIAECHDATCMTPHCVSSRVVLRHHYGCKESRCALCAPVRATIAMERNEERLRGQQSSEDDDENDEGSEDESSDDDL